MTRPVVFALFSLSACSPTAPREPAVADGATLSFQTSVGDFEVVLYQSQSPITSESFLSYVEEGFYDGTDGKQGTTFHRIVPGFVAQAGGYTEAGALKTTHGGLHNEAKENGLSNLKGTLAMARTNQPNSATSQFFVNFQDNLDLDPGGVTKAGYAVFGEVSAGFEVVQAMASVPLSGEEPVDAIVIESVLIVDEG